MNETVQGATDVVQPALQLGDFGLFDQNVLFIQVLDNVLVVVLAVDVDQHGFDRRVTSYEGAWACQH
jgi:hypothetical protein